MRIIVTLATLMLATAAAPPLRAQAQGPVLSPNLSFEVASVKVNKSRTRAPMQWQASGQFTMGLPIFSLVSLGYAVPESRIVGLPDWTRTVFFDINARAAKAPTLDERRAYYRGLLKDRFAMAVHAEERELPVFALVLARADGRLGPGLRRSNTGCDAVIAERVERAEAGERPDPPTPGVRPTCSSVGGPASLTGGGVEISALTGMLSNGLGRPVVDKTGLTGRFDIDFRSAPMRVPDAGRGGNDLPSVFTAVQEQLGLRLESTTAPVPVLVVDRIEMPSED
jgi:uncharacterized protein (TIGR03435 family)